MRRRHRCAEFYLKLSIQICAENVIAGCRNINRRAEVGDAGEPPILSHGGDRDDCIQRGRIIGTGGCIVAGGGYQYTAALISVSDGILDDENVHGIAQAEVNDVRAVVGGVDDGGGDIVTL